MFVEATLQFFFFFFVFFLMQQDEGVRSTHAAAATPAATADPTVSAAATPARNALIVPLSKGQHEHARCDTSLQSRASVAAVAPPGDAPTSGGRRSRSSTTASRGKHGSQGGKPSACVNNAPPGAADTFRVGAGGKRLQPNPLCIPLCTVCHCISIFCHTAISRFRRAMMMGSPGV